MIDLGVPIIVTTSFDDQRREQVRFPRTKRKRIQKKWAKDWRNWRTWVEPIAYQTSDMMGGVQIVCNHAYYEQLRENL